MYSSDKAAGQKRSENVLDGQGLLPVDSARISDCSLKEIGENKAPCNPLHALGFYADGTEAA